MSEKTTAQIADDLKTQAKEALLKLVGEINQPSTLYGEDCDKWIEVYSHLTSALNIVLALPD